MTQGQLEPGLPPSNQLRGTKRSVVGAGGGRSSTLCEPGIFAGTGLCIHAARELSESGRQSIAKWMAQTRTGSRSGRFRFLRVGGAQAAEIVKDLFEEQYFLAHLAF